MSLVSVVVPAFNAAPTLGRTLDSLLAQTHAAIEVIVVDDGSTDTTADIVRGRAADDGRLCLIRQPNAGVAAARNASMAAAHGEWIATIDADDIWHPRKLELQLKAVEQADEPPVMVYSWSRRIDADDRVIFEMGTPRYSGCVVQQLLVWHFMANGSSTMFRRDIALDIGGFDTGLQQADAQGAEDLKLHLALAHRGAVALAPYFLTGYRQLHGSLSHQPRRIRRAIELVLTDYARAYPEVPDTLLDLARMSYDLYASGIARSCDDRRAFFGYMLSALRRRPVDALVILSVKTLRMVARQLRRPVQLKLFQDMGISERTLLPLEEPLGRFQAWSASRAARAPSRGKLAGQA